MSFPEKFPQKASPDTLSVVSRTTSDYFPQSYKRPAPYLLWDDNIVPIHHCASSKGSFSCCRLVLGLLIAVATIGVIIVISVAVYLGVITSYMMEEVTNDQTFDGKFRITGGDTYVEELEDSSSLEFQLKAKKYETMINMLMKESQLNEGYKESEVTGFRMGSLIVFFRLHLDRRKMSEFPRDVSKVIENVIADDAGSVHPRVLKDIEVDINSIVVLDSYPKKKLLVVTKTKSTHKVTNQRRPPDIAPPSATASPSPPTITTTKQSATDTEVPTSETTESIDNLEVISIDVQPENATERHDSTSTKRSIDRSPAPSTESSSSHITSDATTSGVSISNMRTTVSTSFPSRELTYPTTTATISQPAPSATTISSPATTSKDQFVQSIINSLLERLSDNTTISHGYVSTSDADQHHRDSTPLVLNDSDTRQLVYGAWRPLASLPPIAHRNPTNTGVAFDVQATSRVSSAISTTTTTTTTTTQRSTQPIVGAKAQTRGPIVGVPMQRAEALTSGVAQEIPFSLDDLSFSEQHAAASAPIASVRAGGGGASSVYPMETNVATMLMLKHPGGNAGSGGGGGGAIWSGESEIKVTSRPIRRPHRNSIVGQRVTSSPLRRPTNVRLELGSPSRLRPVSSTALRRPSRPMRGSQGLELTIQSGSVQLKEPKRLDLSSSPLNGHQSPSANISDSLLRLDASLVASATASTVRATEDYDRVRQLIDQFLIRTDLGQSSSAGDSSADPMVAEEQVLQVTMVPLPPGSSSLIRQGPHSLLPGSGSGGCSNPKDFRCSSGSCIASSNRCNQVRDCPDNGDEEGCTCADFLNAQSLKEKICDGVVDCWDYSDENRCASCTPDMYVCPNANMCVASNKVCDSRPDCPGGEDEKHCVRISPNQSVSDDGHYHSLGYLMLQRNGQWGLLCTDSLSRRERTNQSSTSVNQLSVADLARSVCHSLTFTDLVSVERKRAPLIPYSRTRTERFYRVFYIPSHANSTTRSVLEFNETSRCRSRDTLWIKCKNLECGTRPMAPSARIVGGTNARAGSWPWQAAMYKSGEYMCGATLINDRWLVSAAHCFYSEVDNHWTARLGMLRRGSQAPFEQIKQISHIIIHANYVKVGFINDVALLRMQTQVAFSDFIRPACLPSLTQESIYNGRVCTVVGWGQLLETGHVFPDTLQEVDLPVFTAEECRKKTVFLQTYQITDNMFCAGFDRGGRDACLGDSGGPLVCQEPNGKWSLVGVTSNGFGCARAWRPGIYTKVSNYIGWMNEVMAGPLKSPVRSYCRGHRCQLGKCLLSTSVCNGYVECLDGSDEHGCS